MTPTNCSSSLIRDGTLFIFVLNEKHILRFPASPEAVKETRDELKAKLQEDEPHNDIELGDGSIADKVVGFLFIK